MRTMSLLMMEMQRQWLSVFNIYHENDVSVNDENVKKRTFSLNTYHENDISVSVSRSQM